MIKISKKTFYSFLILNFSLFSLIQFFHNNVSPIVSIYSFSFISFLPGYLGMIILTKGKIIKSDMFIYSVAGSIAYLLIGGLLLNTLLPIFGNTHPLSFIPIMSSFIISNILLLYFAYKRHPFKKISFHLSSFSLHTLLLFIVPPLIVITSILGTQLLNITGSNWLTAIMLGAVGIFVLIIAISKKAITQAIYPYTIFLIGIAILLMFSLRSFYISGWDINQEYEVFQITKTLAHWSMYNIQQDYNTCLSITILPTIYSSLIGGNDNYIFKFYFQILFAIVPLVMFLIYRKLIPNLYAFFGAFFYISQPFFIQPMPAVIRQEIAFIFFSICIYTLFSKQFSSVNKQILFYFFAVAMILSHYSSSLVAIGLFLLTILLEYILLYSKRIGEKFNILKTNTFYPAIYLYKKNMDIKMPLILLFLTFLWYGQYTPLKNHINGAALSTITNTSNLFNNDLKSNEVSGALSILSTDSNSATQEDIDRFINSGTSATSNQLYNPSTYSNYHPHAVVNIPIKTLFTTQYNSEIQTFFDIVNLLCKSLVLIGGVYFITKRFPFSYYEIEYVYILIVSLGSVFLFMLIPELSIQYNLTRLYMQVLIIVAPSVIYGGIFLLKFLKIKTRETIMYGILILYFLHISGFTSIFFGGDASMQLFNYGDDYDKFYTHAQEVASAQWFKKYSNTNLPIYADEVATLRLVSFAEIDNTQPTFTPKTLQKNSYVYADYANVTREREDETIDNVTSATFTYPLTFLKQNKNLIYNNGGSMIFR